MIYPKRFEEKIGFNDIRQILKDLCINELGQKQIERIRFRKNPELISKLLDQTEDFRQIIISGENFPLSNYYDASELLKKIKPENSYLLPEELTNLWLSLSTIKAVISFFNKTDDKESYLYPSLQLLTKNVYLEEEILNKIEKIINETGEIRDDASNELTNLRRQKRSNQTKAQKQIDSILNDIKDKGLLDDNLELTIRNGRQVIPIPAIYKKQIRGFVHDSSATGQTVFIEPEEVFEINNETRELELAEWQEIVKILTHFTDFLRPYIDELKKCYWLLSVTDAIRAKALLALDMGGMKPKIKTYPVINWVKAVHPLLYLSYKSIGRHVEPLNLSLDKEKRILIISGPNAGGKSVCLKTCGLIQYMFQCGLLVPMADYSETGVFQKLFLDIGDGQSLENDLSTYSSHLFNMKFFIEQVNDKSLLLIDELGAGTEPGIGGAIAESVLAHINKSKPLGIITTHYANVKAMGGKIPGVVNGSMLFDSKKMKPLYKLKTGVPGSSFAFEIAQSIGLPGEILKKASEIAGSEKVEFDNQLQELEFKKSKLDEKEEQLREGEVVLNEMIDKYQQLKEDLETRKSELINSAREEAKQILSTTNQMIERTIKEIKESNANKEKTSQVRQDLKDFSKQLQKETSKETSKETEKEITPLDKTYHDIETILDNDSLKKGDMVTIEGQNSAGEIIDITGKQAIISFGDIKFKASLTKLQKVKIQKPKSNKNITLSKIKYSFDINKKAAEFNADINLRGKNVDDSLNLLYKHIDNAILLGISKIRVIHGKGEGILRKAINDYLITLPEVEEIKPEHPNNGGEGITLVFFS